VTSDINNCGACGNSCGSAAPNTVAGCIQGVCAASQCVQGFADCNLSAQDGCEVNVTNNVLNCGACGHACTASATCVGNVFTSPGVPACNAGFCSVIQAGISQVCPNGCTVNGCTP
jgi:hypothetical protein